MFFRVFRGFLPKKVVWDSKNGRTDPPTPPPPPPKARTLSAFFVLMPPHHGDKTLLEIQDGEDSSVAVSKATVVPSKRFGENRTLYQSSRTGRLRRAKQAYCEWTFFFSFYFCKLRTESNFRVLKKKLSGGLLGGKRGDAKTISN